MDKPKRTRNGKQADIGKRLQELSLHMVRELVDLSDAAEVLAAWSDGGSTLVLTVRVPDGEAGKVIGRRGQTADAMRLILSSVAAKHGTRTVLEIADPKERRDHARADHRRA